MNFKIICEFFNNYDYNDKPIYLNNAEKITDVKLIVESHINILKNQSGNQIFLPYYDRLKQIYEICRKNTRA